MKRIPYKDTFLTFYHYKEPLRKAETGFGYQGALLSTIEGDKVMCHVCGELYADVGRHAISAHKETVPTVRDYKEMFGLAYSTQLISESERDRRKMILIKRWASLSDKEKKEIQARMKKNLAEWYKKREAHRKQPKQALETKNRRGTCPDQLLDNIIKCSESLGKTPTKAEFIDWCDGSQRYVHLIYKTFGSWTNAIKKAGLMEREKVQNNERRRLSDEELLDSLSIFYQENGKVPSYTDSRRGLLPDAAIYVRRFGSFSQARRLAGSQARRHYQHPYSVGNRRSMNMKDVMIDIETLGTRHDALIVQIGAVYFDRETGEKGRAFEVNIDYPDERSMREYTIDFDTIRWWMSQDIAAQNAVFGKKGRPIGEAMQELAIFLSGAERVWSHATFDIPILENAFRATGVRNPVHYKGMRDIRTLMDLSGYTHDGPRGGIHHIALDDAIYQVGYVVGAIRKLKHETGYSES